MPLYEVHALHPRIAHWLNQEGLLYIHEHRAGGGCQIDFVSIHPPSGHVSIIEAKVQIDRYVMPQLNRYHERFGIESASKILFSLLPISDYDMDILEANGFEAFHLPISCPTAEILRLKDSLMPFADIFEATYNQPIQGWGSQIEYLQRTFVKRDD